MIRMGWPSLGSDESFKKNRPNFYFDFGGYEPKFRETFVKEISQPLKFQNKIELTHSLGLTYPLDPVRLCIVL